MALGKSPPLRTLANLVAEYPVAIELNQVSYAVMLCTPHDLEDFVIGFLFSEQIIQHNRDIHEIEINAINQAYVVAITLANRTTAKLSQRQRQLKGTTGCGLCGAQSLAVAFPQLPKIKVSKCWIDKHRAQLPKLRSLLPQYQTIAEHSGALHAAFWLDNNGDIKVCREDIGRHNALDKLLGYLIRHNIPLQEGALLVTSRCSVELVQKAIIAKASTLLSLASPSQLAVNVAKQHGLTLVHIPKTDHPIDYTEE